MLDNFIVLMYFIVVLVIGIYSSKNIRTLRDFAIGDKSYSTVLLITTILATWIGNESSIGMAEKVFSYGIIFVAIYFGSALNKLIIVQFIVPHMEKFKNMMSIGDILFTSYGKFGKMSAGIFGTIFCILMVSAQITGIGYLFSTFLNISKFYGMIFGSSIFIIYTTLGGIKAVTITDLIQLLIIIFVISIISDLGLNMVGGYVKLFEILPDTHINLIKDGENPMKYISLFVIFLIPFLDPAVTQRLFMAKNIKQMSDSLKVVALIEITFYFSISIMGLIALAIAPNINPSVALPYLVDNILPVGLKGIAIAGLLSVIMSTADSFLNSAAITFVHDFITPIYDNKLSEEKKLYYARIVTLSLGIISTALAISFDSTVYNIATYSFYFWVPTILIPLYVTILGLNKHTSFIVLSMLTGILSVFLSIYYDIGNIYGIHPLLVSLATNILLFYIQNKISFILKKYNQRGYAVSSQTN